MSLSDDEEELLPRCGGPSPASSQEKSKAKTAVHVDDHNDDDDDETFTFVKPTSFLQKGATHNTTAAGSGAGKSLNLAKVAAPSLPTSSGARPTSQVVHNKQPAPSSSHGTTGAHEDVDIEEEAIRLRNDVPPDDDVCGDLEAYRLWCERNEQRKQRRKPL